MKKISISLTIFTIILSVILCSMFSVFAAGGSTPTPKSDTPAKIDFSKETANKDQYGGIHSKGFGSNDNAKTNQPIDPSPKPTLKPSKGGSSGKNNNNSDNNEPDGPKTKTEKEDKHPTETYGYYWYIYDLNDKTTEAAPILITDRSRFEHTFNEVGDYRVEKYTVRLRYDYTKFKTYERYIKEYVNFLGYDKDGNPIKKVKREPWWKLISTKDMPNSRSKTKPVTKTLYASNSARLGTVSGGSDYMQLDNNGGGSGGPRIYKDVIISEPMIWTVHITDPPQTWREGDGDTKIGEPPEVYVELVK